MSIVSLYSTYILTCELRRQGVCITALDLALHKALLSTKDTFLVVLLTGFVGIFGSVACARRNRPLVFGLAWVHARKPRHSLHLLLVLVAWH